MFKLVDIIKSNVNSWLDDVADPEKMVKYAVLQIEQQVESTKKAIANAIASEKDLFSKWEKCTQTATTMGENATFALKQGKEELAKKALERQLEDQKLASLLKEIYNNAKIATENLKKEFIELEEKLKQTKLKEQEIVAQSQFTRAMKQDIDNLGQAAIDKINKMEDKIYTSEAKSRAFGESATENSKDNLQSEFDALFIQETLNKMKESLKK